MKRIHPNRCLLSVFSAVTLPASAPRSPQQTANTKPTLHFRPQDAKAGDVIPFYWKGDYHLFYLKGPDWAHVVSRDLLRWQELPNALIKGSDPLGPDWESIWTGSVVEHGGTFYLFYTGKNSNDPLGDQKVMQARSVDLIHWTKHPEYTFYADGKIYWNKTINGAIDDKQIYHHQAFRDPHVVWNGRENRWWLALHAMLADGSAPNVGLYTSRDLTHWTPHAPLVGFRFGRLSRPVRAERLVERQLRRLSLYAGTRYGGDRPARTALRLRRPPGGQNHVRRETQDTDRMDRRL